MTSKVSKSLAVLFLVATASACSNVEALSAGLPAFCEVGRAPEENEKVYFDLKENRAFVAQGSAYNADLTIISTEEYVGIISPMHLIVPTDDAIKNQEPLSWDLQGYSFTVEHPPSTESDWFLVRSRIITEPDNTGATSGPKMGKRAQGIWRVGTDVLYSPSSGIIAYQNISHINGQIFQIEYSRCSDEKLDFKDIE